MQKILRREYFGIEKYLQVSFAVHRTTVVHSDQRESINLEVQSYAEAHGINANISRAIYGIVEEFLTNAIFGAADYDRNSPIELPDHHTVTVTYGFDGDALVVGVSDNLGRLRKDVFTRYTQKILQRMDSAKLVDTKRGGAGIGFFKVLYSCHALICNVLPNRQTEILPLFILTKRYAISAACRGRSVFLMPQMKKGKPHENRSEKPGRRIRRR